MNVRNILLLWVVIIHLLLSALCGFAFRENIIWLLSALFCVMLSAVISAWIWRRIAKSDKISELCTDMINEQDFSSFLRRVGYPEADRMIDVYNRMITELRKQRLQVRDKNAFLDLLIEAEAMGIIILGHDMSVALANSAAAHFLQLPVAQIIGRRLEEFDSVMVRTLSTLTENEPQILEFDGVNRYRCILQSFIDSGHRRNFITIEELTQELIAAEKRASEKVIRTMSHEVNNTLSSINSNISLLLGFADFFPEHLRDDIVRALQISIERSENLCRLISDFANIVKLPPPQLAPVSLNATVQNTVSLMHGKFADAGINCTMQLCPVSPVISVDTVQMEQALINILKNAIEASLETRGDVTVITDYSPAALTVRDSGCGIPEKIRNELFKPFFTTKPGGQGIGLMLVCEILLNHRFTFDLKTKDGYTEFRIMF